METDPLTTAPRCAGDEEREYELTSIEITIIVLFCLVGSWAAQRSWRSNAIRQISIPRRTLDAIGSFFFGVPQLFGEVFVHLLDPPTQRNILNHPEVRTYYGPPGA